MTHPINTEVIGLRGSTLGSRGVVKAFIPDSLYEVYFRGIGTYTVAESAIMPLNEFKAMRDDLTIAQARIAELEATLDKIVYFYDSDKSNDLNSPEAIDYLITIANQARKDK